MPIIPNKSFELELAVSRQEVVDRLLRHVEPREKFRFVDQRYRFEGEVTAEGFELVSLAMRDGALAHGRFEDTAQGTLVEVWVEPSGSATLPSFLACVALGIIVCATAYQLLLRHSPGVLPWLIGVFGFACLATHGSVELGKEYCRGDLIAILTGNVS